MRKIYDEYFHIPKNGKIREKVMLTHIVMTITVIVICLAAMSISAYAYFSYNFTSYSNVIKATDFETKVSVRVTDESGEEIRVNTSDYKAHWIEIKADKEYLITIQHTERSTAQTGFVSITAENCESRYHTQQLGKDGNGKTKTISFKIKSDADTKVTLISHWGTSSYYGYPDENNELYIRDGEKIELSLVSAEESEQEELNESEELTNPVPEETAAPVAESTMPPEEETAAPLETAAPENPTPAPVVTQEPAATEQPEQTAEPIEMPDLTAEASEE